jgi:hypothetical protein
MVVAHELDRLGRSFADLAGFVENSIDIDLVNQPIGTVGEDDWLPNPAACSRFVGSLGRDPPNRPRQL